MEWEKEAEAVLLCPIIAIGEHLAENTGGRASKQASNRMRGETEWEETRELNITNDNNNNNNNKEQQALAKKSGRDEDLQALRRACVPS